MKLFKPKIKWQYRKYLLVINDLTNSLLNKEKRQEDRRVKKLTLVLIIIIIVLVVSLATNVYLVQGV